MRVVKMVSPLIAAVALPLLLLKADFVYLFVWWFAILAIGLLVLPATAKLFPSFQDHGYLFSKTIGIAVPAYIVWLLSSIGIVPFGRLSVFSIYGILLIGLLYFWKKHGGYKQFLTNQSKLGLIILEESMFLALLCFWAYLRGMRPELSGNGGLEKLMDFGFVNTLLNTSFMPPADIWFAGKGINYYYFGQYITAFLTKLTGLKSDIAYNLMMVTLFSFSFSLTFSIALNLVIGRKKEWLKKAVAAGLISALLLSLGGNLHTIFFTTIFPELKSLGALPSNIEVRGEYFFPDATRYIGHNPNTLPPNEDKTIHEFPIYSFVVSDLHAHVINIPFVLTTIALIYSLLYRLLSKLRHAQEKFYWKDVVLSPQFLMIVFFIGIFHMSNYWDYPIYTTVAAIAILFLGFVRYGYSAKGFGVAFAAAAIIIAGSGLISLPFSLKLTKLTNGIGFTHTHSALYQLLILWGSQLFFSVLLIVHVLFHERKAAFRNALKKSPQELEGTFFWPYLLKLTAGDVMALVLMCSAIGLVIAPELIYVKDIYGGGYYRSNTMFKLTYQSFMMFAIPIGYITFRVLEERRSRLKKNILILLVGLGIVLPMLYPFYAISYWYGGNEGGSYKGLDGARIYFERKLPSDWNAVQWLKNHETGQPTIIEAFGDSYTDNCRISALTGFPTVIGWGTHEWLWRNSNDVCEQRRAEVTTVYESTDLEATKLVLKKYNVKYIVIGKLERDKFKSLQENKLLSLGQVVYENKGVKLIQTRKED